VIRADRTTHEPAADLRVLAIAVREMRASQRCYFCTRLPGDLRASKRWEKVVDELVGGILDPQPGLFDW
jgi:hypothetical protein